MRKLLSLVLTLALALSLVSAVCAAFAAEEALPIASEAEFLAMDPQKSYYLSADITISHSYDKDFKGTLDGKGHTVTVSCPMFALMDGAILNVTVNGTITADDGLATAAVARRTVNGMYAENVTTNVAITLSGDKIGMYAAGILASDFMDVNVNNNYYEGKQPANTNAALSVFVNCKNTGNITVNPRLPEAGGVESSKMEPRAGGLAAYVEDVKFFDCENTGNITIPLDVLTAGEDGKYTDTNITSAIAGGIVAKAAYSAGGYTDAFYGCRNSGDVTAYSAAGGIAGYVGVKSNTTHHIFYGCVNTGIITGASRAGGMIGYAYGTLNSDNEAVDMQFCLNAGDILYGNPAGKSFCSPFVAYTNSIGTRISACLNTGKMLELGNGYAIGYKSFLGVSSCNAINCPGIGGNYVYNPDNGLVMFSYAESEDNALNRHTMEEAESVGLLTLLSTLEKVTSGEAAYQMNRYSERVNNGLLEGTVEWNCGFVGNDYLKTGTYKYRYMWHQKLGTDAVPTVENAQGTFVVEENGKYKNADTVEVVTTAAPEPTEEPETTGKPTTQKPKDTTAPETTQAPGTQTPETKAEEKKSGCGSSAAAGVCVAVAVLGAALRKKKDR